MAAIGRHRDDLRWVVVIFIVAFAIRIAINWWVNPDPRMGVDDSWFYHHSARALASGEGYVYPFRDAPTADHPPGYTALLASVYVLPGPDLIAGKLLNALLGATGCSLLFVIGRMMWGRAIGIVAGLLLACFPSHVLYSTLPASEIAYATLLTGVVLLFGWALTRGPAVGSRVPFLLGLALGAATLVRGEGVLLPLVFGSVWWLSTGSLKRGALFAGVAFLGLAIVLSGWTIRNAVQMGAPIPLSTGSSNVLSVAHWEKADGKGNLLRMTYVWFYYEELPYPQREVRASQKQMREALGYMFTHPRHELSLIPKRLYYLYRDDHTIVDYLSHYELPIGENTLDALRTASDTYYFAVLGLGIPGLWLWGRARRPFAVLLLGIVLYMSALIGIFFFGSSRYHAAFVPIVCLLAAPGIVAPGRVARRLMCHHKSRTVTGAHP